jgi:hypothetical protein
MKSPSWLNAYLSNAAMFVPAIAFLLYVRLGPGELDARWGTAYELGGGLAVLHALWLVRTRRRFAIPLGVDLYLIVGGALALWSTNANSVWGAQLGAASVLGCVLVTSAVGLMISRHGFIDPEGLEPARARGVAVAMLAATAVALGVAVIARHDPLLGGVLPILGLVVVQGVLRKRARRAA